MDSITIAIARQQKAREVAVAHAMASDRAEAMHKRLGIPVVVLSIIVGTAAFSTLTDLGKSMPIIAMSAGILSVTAAVLAGLQTFLDYAGRSEAHAKAAAKLNAIADEIDHVLADKKFDQLQQLDARFSKIIEEVPRVAISMQEEAREYIRAHNKAPALTAPTRDVRETLSEPEAPATVGTPPSAQSEKTPSGGGGGGGAGGVGWGLDTRRWHPMDQDRG
ncbi:MAG: SLATT domain-containing protein [Pseudolabrys sp.]